MKTLPAPTTSTFLVACLLLLTVVACDNGSDDPTATPTAVSGQWQVTSFVDNKSRDRTTLFSALTFELTASGELRVNQGTTTLTKGSWKLMQDSGKEKLVLTYTLPGDDLSELSEDWVVTSKTATRLELTNTSGGNGGAKFLVLTKR